MELDIGKKSLSDFVEKIGSTCRNAIRTIDDKYELVKCILKIYTKKSGEKP